MITGDYRGGWGKKADFLLLIERSLIRFSSLIARLCIYF